MKKLTRSLLIATGCALCFSLASTAATFEPTVRQGNVVIENAELGMVVGLDESNAEGPADGWLDRAWVLQSDLPTKEYINLHGAARIEVLQDALVVYMLDPQDVLVFRLSTAEAPEVSARWGEPTRFEGFGLITLTPPTDRVDLLSTALHYGYQPDSAELVFPLKHHTGPFHDDTGDGCGLGPDDPDPNCSGEGGGGGGLGGDSNTCSRSCSAGCADGSSCSVSCAAFQEAICSEHCSQSGVVLTCQCINCY